MLTLRKPLCMLITLKKVHGTISMVRSYNELEINSDKDLVVNTVKELSRYS